MPNGQTEHVRLRTVLFHNFSLFFTLKLVRDPWTDLKRSLKFSEKNDEVKTDRFRRRSEGSLKIKQWYQNGVLNLRH